MRLFFCLFFCFFCDCFFAENVRVGLIYSVGQAIELRAGNDVLRAYRAAIEKHSGQVVSFSGDEPHSLIEFKYRHIDALLIPGGLDLHPSLYGEVSRPELEKTDQDFDRFQKFIVNRALHDNLPILAICRGMQLLNVLRGGSLYQDLPTQHPVSGLVSHRNKINGVTEPEFSHDIVILPETRLSEIMGMGLFKVNTTHHQAARRIGKNLKIIAVSPDGVVEGLECTVNDFVVGVQFHPERLLEYDQKWGKLFKAFLSAALK
jgi:putative glutamine amidotransferase